MVQLSKSKYTRYCQCPKMLWLDTYKKELAEVDPALQHRFDEGHQVGELAKNLFGDYIDVTSYKEDGGLDIPQMLKNTRKCIVKNVGNICEAAFSIDGCYCAVDILHKENDGYEIYEVKSSTEVAEVYLVDIAYQKYVLEKAGVNIVGVYIVHINSQYEKNGDIDVHQFFRIVDVKDKVVPYYSKVSQQITEAKGYVAQKEEPVQCIGNYCNSPYPCAYFNYCAAELPVPNVFDLYRMSFKKACELLDAGIVGYEDILKSNKEISGTQRKQIEFELFNLPTHIDKLGIKSFLDELSFPMYFLDFETFNTCIPIYNKQKPYQQIPFQYSLHILPDDSGKVEHKEFLGDEFTDPRRAIAERLVEDIPLDVCSIAYNKAFECARLTELAGLFSDLSEHLLNIKDNMKDLLDVFRHGYVYDKAMGGSFSIKKVLPAMFPNEPNLDYHNLEIVHNGGEATNAYLDLRHMDDKERKETREALLAYCKLDTFAMVMLWQRLRELCL